jgi:hypothetical protein
LQGGVFLGTAGGLPALRDGRGEVSLANWLSVLLAGRFIA